VEVPALRARNAEVLARLPVRIAAARRVHPSAVVAAGHLASYRAYAGPAGRVVGVNSLLDRAASLLGEARRLNAMQEQRFSEAAELVARAENLLRTAESTMQWALDSYRTVMAAVAALAAVSAEANCHIKRAEARIQRYSRNDQGRARSLVQQAKRCVRRGWELAAADPVAALKQYRSAQSLAQKAYAEVDTSSSSGGGGGVHRGGGGGSSGGPSGGFSGGPSGGFSGGPSGGGVGGGGF
ncbi:MAG: hypothetical protein ACUVTZ_07190, partial [Armatimonadota bacterium]